MKNINIGILSGGKSSRMGQDKAGLTINGQAFLKRLLNLADRYEDCSRIIVSAGHYGSYEEVFCGIDKPIIQVFDQLEDYGPIQGLYRIMHEAESEWVFVTAVDLPFINGDYISYLGKNMSDDIDAIIPVLSGRKHPLCAFYNKRVEGALEKLIQENIHRVMALTDKIRVRYIELPEQYEKILFNINTPEIYKEISDI